MTVPNSDIRKNDGPNLRSAPLRPPAGGAPSQFDRPPAKVNDL